MKNSAHVLILVRAVQCDQGVQETEGGCLEVVGPLEDRDVTGQVPFADSAEWANEVAQPRPDAFHRIAVDLANTIAVVISGVLGVRAAVLDLDPQAALLRQGIVGDPLVGVHGGARQRIVTS